MKKLLTSLLVTLSACSTPATKPAPHPEAQAIVEHIASAHPDVVRLTIHAVPRHESQSRIIASNIQAKLGAPSDPEDLQAMRTKHPIVLQEGANLDYTAPVIDASGNAIAAVGVAVKGSTPAHMRASAEAIARELSTAILAAKQPLW